MNKPLDVSVNDWNLLKEKYPNNLDEVRKKLNNNYPIQYLIGNVDFYGYKILVDERVLIPRYETEYLVEKTINYLKKLNITEPKVLEIGTGSGCISISLNKLINANINAIDISAKALDLAKENAKLNKASINFIETDINNYELDTNYDLIISNPPYIPIDYKVDPKVLYEPKAALYASDNGTYFYKIILEKVKNNLNSNYLIAFEIGDKQGSIIKDYALSIINNCEVIIEKDYNSFERYVFIYPKNE